MPPVTCFPDLNEVLTHLVGGARRVLGPDLIGVYLQGSFAVGDADEGSDVDFLVVTRALLTEAQQKAVQTLQCTIYALPSPWAQYLQGSYFPGDLLRHSDSDRTPIPYFNTGSHDLELSDHDNTLVVRWSTCEHGITLAGPPPRELIEPISAEALRAEVRITLHNWGKVLLADPEGLNSGWRQPYAALSMARMLHTLESGTVNSKRAAVEWARAHLSLYWTPLLERAWAKHSGQYARIHEAADPDDLILTRDFIGFALDHSLAALTAEH